MFTHLHVHTHYSLLDGLAKIPDLLDLVLERGMKACAITDHGVLYGAVEFYREAKKRGIKPIIGCEIYVAPRTLKDKTAKIDTSPFHLVLLCENEQGYKNLIQLVTYAHLEGYYYRPRVDKELLRRYAKGLIALSGCRAGEIPRALEVGNWEQASKAALEYQQIFGKDNFYLELQSHPGDEGHDQIMAKVWELAQSLSIPVVATNDVHYLFKEDNEAHDILLCVQTGNTVADQNRLSMMSDDYSLKTSEEMVEIFKDKMEAIENTNKIAERVDFELKFGKMILPEFPVPEGQTKKSYLEKLAYEGLAQRFGEKSKDKELIKRLEYELSVIEKMGFEAYFLVVADFINWAKNNGIVVGPGRGSAPSSLVAYCLKITDLDPLKYDLVFERFLNPDRISMPDIDTDFSDVQRDKVIRYVMQKYGADHVAQIITFGTMAARNAVRDTGRALGMSYADVDRIAKLIPFNMSLAEAESSVAELREMIAADYAVAKLFSIAKKLEGCVRHASMHAAGVVISKDPLTEYVPLQLGPGANEGAVITQYSMYELDALGLLKMDFLGLSNLTIIERAVEIIKHTKNEEIDVSKIPLDDQKTYELLARAETTGVFQLESEGMKRYIKELRPNTFEDIIAMVALYRPGPMQWIADFIDRKLGRKEIEYLHPLMENALKSTYGVPVYQEQIIQIAKDMAGFSGGEADTLRKAMGKKIVELMAKMREKFIEGSVKNGVSKETAAKVFSHMIDFASYAFNKAHAACYALIAFQTAYLKAHYPSEFMAALLTSDKSNIDRLAIEIAECNRMKIKVLPPDVNESFADFTVLKDGNIRFGLSAIKNIGEGPVEAIIAARKKKPFESLADFVTRVPAVFINKKVIESLAKSGALDFFAERAQILANLDKILSFSAQHHKMSLAGQTGLFGENKADLLELTPVTPATPKERLMWERELMGIFLGEHPLTSIHARLAGKVNSISEIKESPEKKIAPVKLFGLVSAVQKINTRTGEPMAFVKLEDLSAQIELVVFPSIYKNSIELWKVDKILLIEGKISEKDGEKKILVDGVVELTDEEMNKLAQQQTPSVVKRLMQIFVPQFTAKESLTRLKEVLEKAPAGETEISLELATSAGRKKINLPFMVDVSDDLVNNIKRLIGVEPKLLTT
jgi:DNA polymerase-3 subunit alpha